MGIVVRILRPDQSVGYDVTERVEGLGWSNVNPGGHERCTFSLKGDWRGGFPEVRTGNIVRVEDGAAELFTGRIDDRDPQLEEAEQVSVTAYGVGVRLKDDTMRELYVDQDVSRWTSASVQRKLNNAIAGFQTLDPGSEVDATTGEPSLAQALRDTWGATGLPSAEAWYDAMGLLIGSIYYAWKKNINVAGNPAADPNWLWRVRAVVDDLDSSADTTADLQAFGPSTGTLVSTGGNKDFGMLQFFYGVAGGAAGVEYSIFWTCLAVYGTHGLTKQGTATATAAQGFLLSQIVADVCSRVAGVTARQVDTSTYVLGQAAYLDDIHHEDVILDVSKYEAVDWGVWGTDDILGNTADPVEGYLDWTLRDSSVATWTAYREECVDVDLHTEIGTTYDQVAVKYTDPTGKPQRVLRTTTSTALEQAGITTRTATLDGGTLTTSGAQQLGDTFLALSSGNPVSRGRATIKQPIRNINRGVMAPWFMRADGSNLYIPDAFPDRDVFELQSSADRRSIFPIKRVSVDCSGDKPEVSVELDQAYDLMSILLARLQTNVALTIGA